MAKWIRIFAGGGLRKRSSMPGICFGLMLLALPGAAPASDKIVLQLHREPQFEFAGYYAAFWLGFYREAGLDVEIKPGAPPGAAPIDPMREVVERRARFGTGTAGLLISAAQGVPLLLLAPIFQQSAAAVYYRADADFGSPRALQNTTVGRLPPSNILDAEFRTVLHRAGIDPDKLKSVLIEPRRGLDALTERHVDAVVGSVWELPWQARQRSVPVKSFSLGDYEPQFYGDSLFTLQRFANTDPSTVQRFREASLKGWEYALQRPQEIAARMSAELTAQVPAPDAAGLLRYQSEVAPRLARLPDVPLGQSSPERWSDIQQGLLAVGAMSHPAQLSEFIYHPDETKGGFTSRLGLLVLCATSGFALFGASARVWRRVKSSEGTARPVFSMLRVPKPISLLFDRIEPEALIRRILAWVRARHTDRMSINPTDLNAILTALEKPLRRSVPPKVNFCLSLLPELWLASADPDAFDAGLVALVAEAATDMPDGGDLVLGTRNCTISEAMAAEFPGSAPGDYVRITVKDSGRGLSPEYLACVFYPEASARSAAAAAWQMTQRLGGFATVESAEGVGTAVHLYFPRAIGSRETFGTRDADDLPALAAE